VKKRFKFGAIVNKDREGLEHEYNTFKLLLLFSLVSRTKDGYMTG